MLTTKNTYIDSAYHQLQIISQDKQKRLEYETREKAIRDYNQMMYEAEQRGEQRGELRSSKRTAKKLLSMGLEISTIAEATGLSENEIKNL